MGNKDNYQVCWTCRGLFIYNECTSDIDTHITNCSEFTSLGNGLLFQHYVCDQQDYYTIMQIKECINIEFITNILNRKKDLIELGFSHQMIDLLLELGKTKEAKRATLEQEKCTNNIIIQNNTEVNLSLENRRKNEFVPIKCASSNYNTDNTIPNESEIRVRTEYNTSVLTMKEQNILYDQCVTTTTGNVTEFKCKLCCHKSGSSKLMLRHLGTHNNGKKFLCSICNFSTLLRSIWNRHKCRKPETKVFCTICTRPFVGRVALHHHMATQHKESIKDSSVKVFECQDCSYVGRNMSSLLDHQRKHTGDFLYCDQPDCTFKTPYKRSLQQHLQQKHAPEKDQVCHVCGFQTKHVGSLKKHIKLHEGVKQYGCSQCSFFSYSSFEIALHVRRKHLKEKKYACSQCSFKTGYPVALKKHIARHERMQNEILTGNEMERTRRVKPYKCMFCLENFTSVAKVRKHVGQCSQSPLLEDTNSHTRKSNNNVCKVFDDSDNFFDNQLDDISSEVYSITRNMLSAENERKNSFTNIVEDSLNVPRLSDEHYGKEETESVTTCKGRNPMLAESTQTLAAERDSPLLEESLFNLMSDFPRPPTLNRCQSASTLMFASLSPHLVDRPLTPDFYFFCDNPTSSLFQTL